MEKILVWCHGGCFSGGSVEYDKDMRNYLFDHHICQTIPIDFCLTDWDQAIKDIINKIAGLDKDSKVVIGGISSGALMAHHVANMLNLPAILVCPVIKPFTRHDSLPQDLRSRQLKFFQTMDSMKNIEECIYPPNNFRYILYGKTDDRAPMSAFENWLKMDTTTFDQLDQGHEICSRPPVELIAERILNLFETLLRRSFEF